MTLAEILRSKPTGVLSIDPEATVDDAVQKLVRHNVGSLVVMADDADDGESLVGILTERDVLRACAAHRCPLAELKVRAVMSSPVITSPADQSVDEAMGLLTLRRIRHLPVVERGTLLGMISIGDLVKAHHDELSFENHHLKNYLLS
ncbi:MAG: CBS domain-containing protein [Pirellulales bacterium]|nr:CBS domain-containing protein [Pirellulales bacterium]